MWPIQAKLLVDTLQPVMDFHSLSRWRLIVRHPTVGLCANVVARAGRPVLSVVSVDYIYILFWTAGKHHLKWA